jgi:putative RNA 2'-phosphotransferase
MSKELNNISKYFSYLLRHEPESVGLSLNENGWASIDELIEKTVDFKLNRDLIEIVVGTNDKKRFSISDDGLQIKANQGHSIDVDLELTPIQPPQFLVHGTAERFVEAIRVQGLNKMQRHHVHLSESKAVAENVGSRYGKSVLLNISAKEMFDDGFKFYKSANNVWLVDSVSPKYINEM